MHEIGCARNNYKCRDCGDVVAKAEREEHEENCGINKIKEEQARQKELEMKEEQARQKELQMKEEKARQKELQRKEEQARQKEFQE